MKIKDNVIIHPTREIQKLANSIARQHGYGFATEIQISSDGWHKYTTGEYVPNSYRNHFGWKNTYYQHAETTVSILSSDVCEEFIKPEEFSI